MLTEEQYQIIVKSISRRTLDMPKVLVDLINEYICSLDVRFITYYVYQNFNDHYFRAMKWKSCFVNGILKKRTARHKMTDFQFEIRIPWKYVQYFNCNFRYGSKLKTQRPSLFCVARHNKKDPYFRINVYSIQQVVDLLLTFTNDAFGPIKLSSAAASSLCYVRPHEPEYKKLLAEPSAPLPINDKYVYLYFPLSGLLLVIKQYIREIVHELQVVDSMWQQYISGKWG